MLFKKIQVFPYISRISTGDIFQSSEHVRTLEIYGNIFIFLNKRKRNYYILQYPLPSIKDMFVTL